MVEIAKALSQDARILVMDEPTAALSDRETERLFAMIARLKANGVAIIYISHRLAEVFALGDRITVLRDGRKIASLLPDGDDARSSWSTLMVGRAGRHDLHPPFCVRRPATWCSRSRISPAESGVLRHRSDRARPARSSACAAWSAPGRTEVARAIFGADRMTAGEIRLFGEPIGGLAEALDASAAWR